ncbi:unnamed protein product, partial [Prorocentrum cordatum]
RGRGRPAVRPRWPRPSAAGPADPRRRGGRAGAVPRGVPGPHRQGEIVQTYKLDRVLSTRRGDPKLAAAMARNDAKLRARDRPPDAIRHAVRELHAGLPRGAARLRLRGARAPQQARGPRGRPRAAGGPPPRPRRRRPRPPYLSAGLGLAETPELSAACSAPRSTARADT